MDGHSKSLLSEETPILMVFPQALAVHSEKEEVSWQGDLGMR